MSVRKASDIEARPIDWVWRKHFAAGMIHVVSGRAGEQKSTFTRLLAADVSQTDAVIYSNAEDAIAETIRPGLEAAGAVMRRVFVVDEPYVFPGDVAKLEKKIKETRARLVVCDSAAQHFSVSMGSGQAVRRALTPLKVMLERTGCALVFVDHLRKKLNPMAHPLEALTGSGSGVPAAARFVYMWGTNPKTPEERILAPVKVNAVRMDTSLAFESQTREVRIATKSERQKSGRILVETGALVLIDDRSPIAAHDLMRWNGKGRQGKVEDGGDSISKVAAASEWLTGYLMFGRRKASDIETDAGAAGFSWASLRRCSKKLDVQKAREGFGKDGAWYWRLPDGHLALQMAAQMVAAGMGPADAAGSSS